MPSDKLDDLLRLHFGFREFRPGQRSLIEAVLSGRDALGVLPTAGGKSLCYQLPALMLKGLTVVVSPLIALMKDQVDAFNRRGCGLAVALHSNLSWTETNSALSSLHRGEAALLYVAPERLEGAEFRERLRALKPSLLVIDEVHCVSLWGHDFRPSYLGIAELAEFLRPVPILALTATATPETRADILKRLGARDPVVHVAPFDRPNLRFEVHPCGPGEKPRRLKRILQDLAGIGSQIVYVGRRKDAEEIAADLNRERLGAAAYHAGLPPAERREVQESWLAGKTPIAVATIAFGMGIDKADVRAVIHYQHPASLESYYQEAGRAGRDGLSARCVLLFSARDASLARFFIKNRYPTREQVLDLAESLPPRGVSADEARFLGDPELTDEQRNVALLSLEAEAWIERGAGGAVRRGRAYGRSLSLDRMFLRKERDHERLQAMVSYASEEGCHRSVLLRYFGEQAPAGHRCGNCSACSGGTEQVSRSAAEDEVERVVRRRAELFARLGVLGGTGIARFLAGSNAKRMSAELRALPEYGSIPGLSVRALRKIANRVLERFDPADAARGGKEIDGRESRGAHAPAAFADKEARSGTDSRADAEVAEGRNRKREARVPGRGRARVRSGPVENEVENAVEGADSGLPGNRAFWSSPERSFTREELEAREVQRATGLRILELLAATLRGFAPSRIVGILKGKGSASGDEGDPEVARELGPAIAAWGSLADSPYGELLQDVLAMWAKGYLEPAGFRTRRLLLSLKGREVLARRATR